MEKLGVETDSEKTASEGRTCPKCGQDVIRRGAVVKCPTHGTKPFEHERAQTGED